MRTKILVVDPDELAVASLRQAFELQGAEVIVTPDGDEGIQLAEQHQPGLIILAIELRDGARGYSICKRIKRSDVLKTIPLFITSSTATPDIFDQHRGLKTRAQEYFFKPLDVTKLLATAQNYTPIGSGTDLAFEPADEELIEVGDDLIIEDQIDLVDLVEIEEPAPPAGFSSATEAEIDSAIGELSGALTGAGPAVDAPSVPAASPPSVVSKPPAEARLASVPSPAARAPAPVTTPVPAPSARRPHASTSSGAAVTLEAEVKRLSELLKQRDEAMAELRTKGSHGEREVLKLRNELNTKDRQNLELKDQLFAKDSTLLELRESADDMDARVRSRDQEMGGLTSRIASAEAHSAEVEASLDQTQSQLSSAQAQTAMLRGKVDTASQREAQSKQQKTALENELASTKASLTDATQTNATLRSELTTRTGQLTEAVQKAELTQEQFESDIETERQQVELLNQKIEVIDADLAQIKEEAEAGAAAAETRVNEIQSQADDRAIRVRLGADEKLKAAETAAEAKLADAQRETETRLHSERDSQIEAVKAENQVVLSAIERELSAFKSDAQDSRQRAAEFEGSIASLNEERARLVLEHNVDLDEKAVELGKLRSQLDAARHTASASQEEISRLQDHQTDLNKVLSATTTAQTRLEERTQLLTKVLDQIATLTNNIPPIEEDEDLETELVELSPDDVVATSDEDEEVDEDEIEIVELTDLDAEAIDDLGFEEKSAPAIPTPAGDG